jgi:hypothetical protein
MVADFAFLGGEGEAGDFNNYADLQNPGTNNGAIYTGGRYGPALKFDVSGTEVVIPSNAGLDLATGLANGFTIHMDVSIPIDYATWVNYITKGTTSYIGIDGFGIIHHAPTGQLRFYVDGVYGAFAQIPNAASRTDDSFVLTCTFSDSDVAKVYFNGELVYTESRATPTISTNPDILLGNNSSNSFPHDGLISRTRIYNYDLSPQRVKEVTKKPWQDWDKFTLPSYVAAAASGGGAGPTPPTDGENNDMFGNGENDANSGDVNNMFGDSERDIAFQGSTNDQYNTVEV